MAIQLRRALALIVAGSLSFVACAQDSPHNVILFVPDGLRSQMVRPDTAPAMTALRDSGVAFINSHSVYPTVTTANASAMATGHYLGDTGDFGNALYVGHPVVSASGSVTPFMESDSVLEDMDRLFSSDYLNEETLLAAARKAGFNTAAVGKLGPTLVHDHTARSGQTTLIADDWTGSDSGIPLPQWASERLTALGLPTSAPPRGENGKAGDAVTPGTLVPNTAQQQWFVDVFDKVVLKKFKRDGKPFVAVFWSRDPDGTQHNQGDSLNKLAPGINGPSSLAAIRNVDDDLRQIRETLAQLGLDETTDIVISADHGFSTLSKQSATSSAAHEQYADVPPGYLPPGFLGKDLAKALSLPLWDPDQQNAAIIQAGHSKSGNALLGPDPSKPLVVVAANGATDLIYLPSGGNLPASRKLAGKIVATLLAQDYVSGIFVNDGIGKFAGALSMRDINLQGSAVTPTPSIVVGFRSFSTGCELPYTCGVEVADNSLQQGQGMHGAFSRADTFNFVAAYGPDFKRNFVDSSPVSNADVGRTLAAILKLKIDPHGKLLGRVITEAMPGGAQPTTAKFTLRSAAAPNGLRTVMRYQQVGNVRYFDAGGFPGRTLGLDD